MFAQITFGFFGALALQLAVNTCAVPQYTVDLDTPARQRWRHIARDYKDWLVTSSNLARGEPASLLKTWAEITQIPSEYKDELQGFVDELNHPNVTLNDLIFSNIAYERGAKLGCSGGLVAMENGTMIHGRNMDILPFTIDVNGKPTSLEDITIEVNFIRQGKPLFTGVYWPGFVGIHTAMRYGGWTIEQNSRFLHNNVSLNFEAMTKGMLPHMFVLRTIMEQTADFDGAVHALSTTPFAAPQYFIIAGSRSFQGAVVSVDRGGQLLPDTPPVQYVHQGKKDWFLVQTNDDLLTESKDNRRETGELAMEVIGQQAISVNSVMRVMQTEPVWNIATVFTWVASPALGTHVVKIHRETKMDIREKKKAFLRPMLID